VHAQLAGAEPDELRDGKSRQFRTAVVHGGSPLRIQSVPDGLVSNTDGPVCSIFGTTSLSITSYTPDA
jgi:hypothetical protein